MVKIDCLHRFDELCSCAVNLDIRHLKLIVAVTEEKSVTRAGEVLHLTQSALSHQLREIEERLGTPLFLRMNKKMILTQAGERLLRTARQVLDEMKRAEDHISQMAANRQGTLRISTECYTCYHWLPDVMKDFRRKFPGVEVKIDADATHRPIQALLQGKLDLAIVSEVRRDKQLQYRALFEDEFVAVMSTDHPLIERPYITAADFADQNLILYVGPEESTLYDKVLRPAGVTPARLSVVPLTEAIIEMVKAGLGISALARWAVKDQIAAGKIVARPLTRRGLHRRWHAVTVKQNIVPAYIDEFIALLSRPAMPVGKPDIVRFVSSKGTRL
jgi:LysR family transcriptional regulator, regulator for metE and metH